MQVLRRWFCPPTTIEGYCGTVRKNNLAHHRNQEKLCRYKASSKCGHARVRVVVCETALTRVHRAAMRDCCIRHSHETIKQVGSRLKLQIAWTKATQWQLLHQMQACSGMPCKTEMSRAQGILQATLVFCFALQITAGSRLRKNDVSRVDRIGFGEDQYPMVSWPDNRMPGTSQGDHLKVCDCEMAPSSNHGGLLCDKEGYFITSFEAVGHWVRWRTQAGILRGIKPVIKLARNSVMLLALFAAADQMRACADKWWGPCPFEPCEMLPLVYH